MLIYTFVHEYLGKKSIVIKTDILKGKKVAFKWNRWDGVDLFQKEHFQKDYEQTFFPPNTVWHPAIETRVTGYFSFKTKYSIIVTHRTN